MRHVKGSCCTTIKNIGVSSGKTQILHDVSFHLHCGELTVIIGPNGAGKTTLLKALLGELRHTGQHPVSRSLRGRTAHSHRLCPQKLDLDPNSPVSVYDFFAAMISRRPVFLSKGRFLHQKIGEYLAEFEMDDKLDRRLCDLSGGELQRVLLAVATHPAPELLILDEPVSGIDSNGMSVFYEKLGRSQAGAGYGDPHGVPRLALRGPVCGQNAAFGPDGLEHGYTQRSYGKRRL